MVNNYVSWPELVKVISIHSQIKLVTNFVIQIFNLVRSYFMVSDIIIKLDQLD